MRNWYYVTLVKYTRRQETSEEDDDLKMNKNL
jgi:hypothetical protein